MNDAEPDGVGGVGSGSGKEVGETEPKNRTFGKEVWDRIGVVEDEIAEQKKTHIVDSDLIDVYQNLASLAEQYNYIYIGFINDKCRDEVSVSQDDLGLGGLYDEVYGEFNSVSLVVFGDQPAGQDLNQVGERVQTAGNMRSHWQARAGELGVVPEETSVPRMRFEHSNSTDIPFQEKLENFDIENGWVVDRMIAKRAQEPAPELIESTEQSPVTPETSQQGTSKNNPDPNKAVIVPRVETNNDKNTIDEKVSTPPLDVFELSTEELEESISQLKPDLQNVVRKYILKGKGAEGPELSGGESKKLKQAIRQLHFKEFGIAPSTKRPPQGGTLQQESRDGNEEKPVGKDYTKLEDYAPGVAEKLDRFKEEGTVQNAIGVTSELLSLGRDKTFMEDVNHYGNASYMVVQKLLNIEGSYDWNEFIGIDHERNSERGHIEEVITKRVESILELESKLPGLSQGVYQKDVKNVLAQLIALSNNYYLNTFYILEENEREDFADRFSDVSAHVVSRLEEIDMSRSN